MPKPKEKKRQVHWEDNSADQQEEIQELLPQFKKPRTISFNKLKTQIISILTKEESEKSLPLFIQEVLPFPEKKEEFFNAQGHNILAYLLVHDPDPKMKALNLIKNLFTDECLRNVIHTESSKCLKDFLLLQASQEMFAKDNGSVRDLRVEKTKFLLRLDYELVKRFFTNSVNQAYFTVKIKEDFDRAERELKEQSRILINAKI